MSVLLAPRHRTLQRGLGGFGAHPAAWSELGHDYNLADGRVRSLVLAWLAFGPVAVRELRRR